MPRPDFSPAMLRFFLAARFARARHDAVADGAGPSRARRTARAETDRLRRLARVTAVEMDMARASQLLSPEARARLWGALGHVPAEHGIVLTHGGQEHG
ncbi:MAG: hypothetical protein AB7O88_23710 [Reyranellaceae bacterium]